MNKLGNIREPIKKNSIEKKKKIIEKGFELMCNNGYHNVNCVDIAHYAGVSTGIIYQYFKDKRDIFIAGIKLYAEKITFPMLKVMEQEEITKDNIKSLIEIMIDKFVETHTISEKAHEELMAMSCLDEEIATIFYNYEIEITNKVSNILKEKNLKITNIEEKVHIIYGLMDNYCHEVVYHKHKTLSYDIMKEEIIKIIVNVLL